MNNSLNTYSTVKHLKLFSIVYYTNSLKVYYMNALKGEDLKQLKEIYNDDSKQNDTEIISYVCFEEQFNYCILKNITI